jgi:hypothetical protein
MQLALITLSALVASPAFAGVTITCAKDPYRVNAELSGKKAPYVLYKRSKEVARGEMKVLAAEYEDSFMKAFVIALQSDDAVLGVGVPAIKDLNTRGTFEGKADLFVPSRAGNFDGSTVDCTVTIN